MSEQTNEAQGAVGAEMMTAGQSLDLRDLHAANIARQAEWCPEQVPDLSFRGNELGGECGEAQNVIKKLERERQGWRGSRATKDDLADELADVVICADLCAVTADIDLGAAVRRKFNATSEKQGLSVFLPGDPAALATPRTDSDEGTAGEISEQAVEALFGKVYHNIITEFQPEAAKRCIRAALEATATSDTSEPVAWAYERYIGQQVGTGEYIFAKSPTTYLATTRPSGPEGSIRNVRPLYATHAPATPPGVPDSVRAAIRELVSAVYAITTAPLVTDVARLYRAVAPVAEFISASPAGQSAAAPEAVSVDIQRMRLSDNRTDYFVRVKCGDRETTPFVFRDRYKAEHEADRFRWIFGLREEQPDVMAYDETTHPND